MGKKLAIKGHPTRGKEVIELLEMMGGRTMGALKGNTDWYMIDECENNLINIHGHNYIQSHNFITFTLEEFLEKYPFKVGDKVFLYDNITEGYVTGMKWDEDKGTVKYCVYTSSECWCDVKDLLKWNAIDLVEKHYQEQCGEMAKDITLKHLYESGMKNIKDEFRKEFCERCGSQRCSGQDDELEYCERFKNIMDNSGTPFVENHKMEEIKTKREYDELRMPLDDDDKLATEVTIMGKRILPPDGYLVGKITQTDNGMLVEYVNKKLVYPKTYEECYDEDSTELHFIYVDKNERDLYESFIQLIRCRDAYWKIAGEEMGLGKPWEPEYASLEDNTYFTIQTFNGEIDRSATSHRNAILAFPTIEMRDAFYENFKDLIENCKELL